MDKLNRHLLENNCIQLYIIIILFMYSNSSIDNNIYYKTVPIQHVYYKYNIIV